MGFDYAVVHLKYTIPPAIVLSFLYWPLCTRLDLYRILFLISIAVLSTTPWDSYLIRCKIWTYPPRVILGPTLFSIPAEEIFFFIIQTYNTSLLYLILNKPTFKPAYLVGTESGAGRLLAKLKRRRAIGQVLIATATFAGGLLIWAGGEGTYLGLILAWVGPFALLLWTLSYQLLGNLPFTNTVVPIAVPTLYLWFVDTLALQRGTWSIEPETKLGIHLWDCLEIEEAIFFLLTNLLIVFGLVTFDNAIAVLEAFPGLFPVVPALPSPIMLIQALLTDPTKYDNVRILGIQEAVTRLRKKSRSFYLASSVFSGRLRIDLILLYSFCRVADDLVDNSTSESSARKWILRLSDFLDQAYANSHKENRRKSAIAVTPDTINDFPSSTQSALLLLPTSLLSSKPLYDLLCGFKTDLEFLNRESLSTGDTQKFPIAVESELELYARRVAGTVAELCLELVFHHSKTSHGIAHKKRECLIRAGGRMGIALQYVNIARDVATDAAIGRVYLPTSWLEEEGLIPTDILKNPSGEKIERLRDVLLSKAFGIYAEAKEAMAHLPPEARGPMRVAVESYMEIGRVLSEKGYVTKAGKATVPKMRRIRVAWKSLTER